MGESMKFIVGYVQRLLGAEDSDRRFILKQAGGIYFLRMLNQGLNFIITYLLAHYLSLEEYGKYNLAFAWAATVSILALLGIARLAVSELSRLHIQQRWGYLRGFLEWSFRSAAVALFVAMLIFDAGVMLFVHDEALRGILWMGSLLIPARGFIRLLQSSAEGLKVIARGRVPDMVTQPFVFISSMLLMHVLLPSYLTAVTAIFYYAITSYLISVGGGIRILLQAIPAQVRHVTNKAYDTIWKKRAPSFLFISTLNTVDGRLGVLLLGFWATGSDIALYKVSDRLVVLISLIMIAFAPPVVRIGLQAYLKHQPRKLQRVVTRSVWLMLVFAFPIATALIVWGKFFLHFFGEVYVSAYPAVVILSLAQIVNVLSGNLGQLLANAGFEKFVSLTITVSLLTNIILGFWFIPLFGFMGAAIARATSLAYRNIMLLLLAKKQMNIRPPVLSRF